MKNLHAQVIRLGRLKNDGIIKLAARHNLREIAAEVGCYGSIDGSRIHMNYILRGANSADDVARTAQALIEQAGIEKLRVDAIHGVEIIASLRPHSPIDDKAFFNDVVAWAERYFYPAPILSAVVHLDQNTPHCHMIFLPLIAGHMVGSEVIGDKNKLQDMQASFHRHVGERYGLTRKATGNASRGEILSTDCMEILETLKARPELLNEPKLGHALMVAFSYNSEDIFLALGGNVKPIDFNSAINIQAESKPIDFVSAHGDENNQSLSCVDFINYHTTSRGEIAV